MSVILRRPTAKAAEAYQRFHPVLTCRAGLSALVEGLF